MVVSKDKYLLLSVVCSLILIGFSFFDFFETDDEDLKVGIVTDVDIVQDYGVPDDGIISDVAGLEKYRVFNGSVDDASAGYKSISHLCSGVVLSGRKIVHLGIDIRILLEEIVPYLGL